MIETLWEYRSEWMRFQITWYFKNMGQQEMCIMCNGYKTYFCKFKKKKKNGQIIGGDIAQSAPMLSGPWLLEFETIL